MNAQTPGAFGLSVLIHGAAALLIFFFTYYANEVSRDAPKVFELVAGAGDNYAATAAPALGSPGGSIKMPAVEARPLPPEPKASPAPKAAPEPRPVASPIQSAPEKAPAKPKKVPDLAAELKRVEARREKRLEAKYLKEQEAERRAAAAAAKVSHIDAEGIREGVIGGSTENKKGGAGGRALTREEGSELDAYFALLKARIKENHVPPEGVSDSLVAQVEFAVAADGSISRVRLIKRSGNTEFDLSAIEACEHTRSIGARPDGRSDTVLMTFRMREDDST
jgi:TonB family protein